MSRFSLVVWVTVFALACQAALLPPNAEKLAQVAKGEVLEARASWWGYDPADSYEQLSAALNSGVKTLVVDRQAGNWISSKTLRIPSGIEVVLEEGVVIEAKRGEFKARGINLIYLRDARNVILRGLGKGATIKMHKEDYVSKDYTWSTHRHCLSICSCENIVVENLACRDSGGDGIYLSNNNALDPTRNIIIRDVVCDNNYRQGVSVICGINVIMDNVKMINTGDTPPSAGIDFEPNNPDKEQIFNFIMRGCLCESNKGCGIDMYLQAMTKKSGPLGILVEDCVVRGNSLYELKLCINNTDLKRMSGHVTFRNCSFENNPRELSLNGTSDCGPTITFDNVTLKNIGDKTPSAEFAPIKVVARNTDEGTGGNIHFRNVTVHDVLERAPFAFYSGNIGVGGLDNVSGSIKTIVDGKEKVYSYDNAWAAKTYPKRDYVKVPSVSLKDVTVMPLNENASVSASWAPFHLRDGGRFLIYAKAGEALNIKTCINLYAKKKACKMNIRLFSPARKILWRMDATQPCAPEIAVGALPETGIYSLEFLRGSGAWAGVTACNRPIAIDLKDGDQNFIAGGGTAYFYVPEGRDTAIWLYGEGREGLGAEIYAPDGTRIFENKGFVLPQETKLLNKKAKGGVYKLVIRHPQGIPFFEDHFIALFGIAPLLSPVPEYVFIGKEK